MNELGVQFPSVGALRTETPRTGKYAAVIRFRVTGPRQSSMFFPVILNLVGEGQINMYLPPAPLLSIPEHHGYLK